MLTGEGKQIENTGDGARVAGQPPHKCGAQA